MLRRFLSLDALEEDTRLYHYTRCQSAREILRGHSFFATNTQFLNDVNEMQYILSVMDEILEEMNQPVWDAAHRHMILDNVREFHKYEYYVLSFSAKPDSLTLWAEFGDKTGYNLEFEGRTLRDRIKEKTEIFCDGYVVYDRETQKEILRKLITEKIPQELSRPMGKILETVRTGGDGAFADSSPDNGRFAEGGFGVRGDGAFADSSPDNGRFAEGGFGMRGDGAFAEYKHNVQKALALYALFFKQPEFESEKEYRFVFRNPPNEVFFREQNGFLLPYIVLNCSMEERLPVRGVTVAPKNHTDLARRGMEYYLYSLGYQVPVRLSQLKLRY